MTDAVIDRFDVSALYSALDAAGPSWACPGKQVADRLWQLSSEFNDRRRDHPISPLDAHEDGRPCDECRLWRDDAASICKARRNPVTTGRAVHSDSWVADIGCSRRTSWRLPGVQIAGRGTARVHD